MIVFFSSHCIHELNICCIELETEEVDFIVLAPEVSSKYKEVLIVMQESEVVTKEYIPKLSVASLSAFTTIYLWSIHESKYCALLLH